MELDDDASETEPPSIYECCMEGAIDRVREILREHPELADEPYKSRFNELAATPIMHAIKGDNVAIVEMLDKEFRVNMNTIPLYGMSLLHVAVCDRASACVEYLIRRGMDVNARTVTGQSVLYQALLNDRDWFEYWRESIIPMLLEAGAKIDLADPGEDWQRILGHCCFQCVTVAAMLLRRGLVPKEPYVINVCRLKPVLKEAMLAYARWRKRRRFVEWKLALLHEKRRSCE